MSAQAYELWDDPLPEMTFPVWSGVFIEVTENTGYMAVHDLDHGMPQPPKGWRLEEVLYGIDSQYFVYRRVTE